MGEVKTINKNERVGGSKAGRDSNRHKKQERYMEEKKNPSVLYRFRL